MCVGACVYMSVWALGGIEVGGREERGCWEQYQRCNRAWALGAALFYSMPASERWLGRLAAAGCGWRSLKHMACGLLRGRAGTPDAEGALPLLAAGMRCTLLGYFVLATAGCGS